MHAGFSVKKIRHIKMHLAGHEMYQLVWLDCYRQVVEKPQIRIWDKIASNFIADDVDESDQINLCNPNMHLWLDPTPTRPGKFNPIGEMSFRVNIITSEFFRRHFKEIRHA
jgi:hypothetical protein